MALMTGLLGGFGHCAGMCGPLVGSIALVSGPLGPRRAVAGQLIYHLGRLTTYAFLGGLFGLTGAFVDVAGRLAGLSHAVAVGAGALMIALGLGTLGSADAMRRLEARFSTRVVAFVKGLMGGGPGRLYPLGLALGFLPCGLSFTVFLGSAGIGSLLGGGLFALAFGLGTLPALFLAGALATYLGVRARGALYRLGGVVVVAMGILFLARGLSH